VRTWISRAGDHAGSSTMIALMSSGRTSNPGYSGLTRIRHSRSCSQSEVPASNRTTQSRWSAVRVWYCSLRAYQGDRRDTGETCQVVGWCLVEGAG
jgi:hypothetical protein